MALITGFVFLPPTFHPGKSPNANEIIEDLYNIGSVLPVPPRIFTFPANAKDRQSQYLYMNSWTEGLVGGMPHCVPLRSLCTVLLFLRLSETNKPLSLRERHGGLCTAYYVFIYVCGSSAEDRGWGELGQLFTKKVMY